MNGKDKEALIVTSISAVLALTVALFAFFDAEYVEGELVWYVLAAVWAFGVPPAYVVFYRWMNGQSFRTGALLGVWLGFALFAAPALFSPALAVWYYVSLRKDGDL